MKRGFRLTLFLIMIVFATTISFAIAFLDQRRITTQLEENIQFQIEEIEAIIEYSLQNIDKVYHLFDDDTASRMKEYTYQLLELYDENPNFNEWDFQELSERFGMDIYIINENNVITHSSLVRDIGIDFQKCCGTLTKILNERRMTGGFYHDGMDIDQGSGEITKYSYMATNDKKYIIELGYNLQEGEIFNLFNFIRTSKEMLNRYPIVNDITVFNIGGIPYGKSIDTYKLTGERKEAFKKSLLSGEVIEVNGEKNIYRYVPYTSEYDDGQTKNKVIEIIYDNTKIEAELNKSRKLFVIKLAIILSVTFILSLIISKLVSKPMYMAFHDSLTGLKNRAAFEERLSRELEKKDRTIALLMFDLDNFKLVNDYFGHDCGDDLLKGIGNYLKGYINKDIEVFRLGGDEFAILMLNASPHNVEAFAQKLLKGLSGLFKENETYENINVTASIGIAFVQDKNENIESLYKKADLAMYRSKEMGKNQYFLY